MEVARLAQRWQSPPNLRRVDLHITLLGAYATFTHITAYTLARSPPTILYVEDFSCVATFTANPIAAGWSDSSRAGYILARYRHPAMAC